MPQVFPPKFRGRVQHFDVDMFLGRKVLIACESLFGTPAGGGGRSEKLFYTTSLHFPDQRAKRKNPSTTTKKFADVCVCPGGCWHFFCPLITNHTPPVPTLFLVWKMMPTFLTSSPTIWTLGQLTRTAQGAFKTKNEREKCKLQA